ncbi:MAG: hypothetical protein HY916_03710 [Desulfovibrio sp.]|nr:hypothetical protein [Desulfovibrio sp.]
MTVLSVLHELDREGLTGRLADIQRKAAGLILTQNRSRLDGHISLSVLVLQGADKRIRELLESFQTLEGVSHAWLSECPEKPIGTRSLRRALGAGLAEHGWACTPRGMVMTMPLILTCGAELLWKQLLAMRPDDHQIAVSFSVHLGRDAFLHVAVLKRPAGANLSVLPLPSARRRALSYGQGSAPDAASAHF